MEETNKTAMTSLMGLKASAAEMGQTLNACVAQVLHQSKLCGRVAKREPLLKKTHIKSLLKFTQRPVGDSELNWKTDHIDHDSIYKSNRSRNHLTIFIRTVFLNVKNKMFYSQHNMSSLVSGSGGITKSVKDTMKNILKKIKLR